MICPYCNNNVADGYAQCPSCGAALNQQPAQGYQQAQTYQQPQGYPQAQG